MKNRTARIVAAAAVGLGMFAPAGAAMAADSTVTPAPPVFRDACNTDKDEVVIPFTQGVDYYMSGVKVNPGVRPVNAASPRAEVFTRAQAGYTLSAPASWAHTFDAERGCDGEAYVKTGNVEPTATGPVPEATDGGSQGPAEQSTPVQMEAQRSVKVGDFTVTAGSVRAYTADYFRPDNGKFIAVSANVKNGGSTAEDMYGMDFDVSSASGSQYPLDRVATIGSDQGQLTRTVSPGNAVDVTLVFDVPTDFEAAQLHITDIWGRESYTLALAGGTQVIQNTDGELPRTGFASDMVMVAAVLAALGAGGALVVNRRMSSQVNSPLA